MFISFCICWLQKYIHFKIKSISQKLEKSQKWNVLLYYIKKNFIENTPIKHYFSKILRKYLSAL